MNNLNPLSYNKENEENPQKIYYPTQSTNFEDDDFLISTSLRSTLLSLPNNDISIPNPSEVHRTYNYPNDIIDLSNNTDSDDNENMDTIIFVEGESGSNSIFAQDIPTLNSIFAEPTSTTIVDSFNNNNNSHQDIPTLNTSLPIFRHPPCDMECPICFDIFPANECIILQCGDCFCISCLKSHVETQFLEGVKQIACPLSGKMMEDNEEDENDPLQQILSSSTTALHNINNCQTYLTNKEIQSLLSSKQYTIFENRGLETILFGSNSLFKRCPIPDCSYIYSYNTEEDTDITYLDCPMCKQSTCIQCKEHYTSDHHCPDSRTNNQQIQNPYPVLVPAPQTPPSQTYHHQQPIISQTPHIFHPHHRHLSIIRSSIENNNYRHTVDEPHPFARIFSTTTTSTTTTVPPVSATPLKLASQASIFSTTTTSSMTTSSIESNNSTTTTNNNTNTEVQATQSLMDTLEIKLCNRCQQGIIKNEGCHKVKCRCGYRFCWICGSENAQCNCTPAHHGFYDNIQGYAIFDNLRTKESPT